MPCWPYGGKFACDMLKRNLLCLALLAAWAAPAFHLRAATADDPFARWKKEIAAFESADAKQPPAKGAILFIGSSSIRLWKTLAQDFPQHRVINRGFGGSQIVDSTHFADRIVFPCAPRQIVMSAGANDIHAGKSPEQVASDFLAFAAKVHSRLPEVPIAFISMAGNPARWKEIEQVRAANALIKALCEADPKLTYINTAAAMLGSDGRPRPDIFMPDRLHMNAEGYKLWTHDIAPHLTPEPKPAVSAAGRN